MKHLPFASFLLALCIFSLGCNRKDDCEGERVKVFIPMGPELQNWMTAASTLDFQMVDADSTVIEWKHDYGEPGGIPNTIDCFGDPPRPYQYAEIEYRYSADTTGEFFTITLRAILGVSSLEIKFNDGLIRYYAVIGRFGITKTSEGEIRPTGRLLPTYRMRGHDWTDVLAIDAHASFIIYPKIWFAKGIGIIRYENQAGKAWERLP